MTPVRMLRADVRTGADKQIFAGVKTYPRKKRRKRIRAHVRPPKSRRPRKTGQSECKRQKCKRSRGIESDRERLATDGLRRRTRDDGYRHERKSVGISVSRYVTGRKLEASKALLNGGYSVSEASYQLGFATESYYISCFRRAYGVTPAVWKAESADGITD